MKNKLNNKGFTLAEVLIVVAILVVVMAFGIIAVQNYLRSMTKLEYDGYAKEIFIAAQNHLSTADAQGFLGSSEYGRKESDIPDIGDNSSGVRYYIVDPTHDKSLLSDRNSILRLMLPFGSLDETIRTGGCYIVRYHKDSAQILDVYYWSESGRYPYVFPTELAKIYEAYKELLNHRGSGGKSGLKSFSDGKAVIGYYGGEDASNLTKGDEILAPAIAVTNADKLTVKVSNPNRDENGLELSNVKLRLVVTGVTSGNSRYIDIDLLSLTPNSAGNYLITQDANGDYIITLDDITQPGFHFYDLFCTSNPDSPFVGNNLIAGEDIKIQAVAYDNSQFTNVATSSEQKTNSLFGAVTNDGTSDTAQIGSIRHLENLNSTVSGVGTDYSSGENEVTIESANQYSDLSWTDYVNKIKAQNGVSDVSVYPKDAKLPGDNLAPENKFVPIQTGGSIVYNGGNHSISDVSIETTGSAGLFASLPTGSSVSDLRLVDFSVTAHDSADGSVSGNAGVLAGTVTESTISGVEVCNTAGKTTTVTGDGSTGGLVGTAGGTVIENSVISGTDVKIKGGDSTGGIVGSVTGGSIIGSSASVIVESTGGNAGGLAGTANGTVVEACYTGGQTKDGEYKEYRDADGNTVKTCVENVKGAGNVGGLIGQINGGVVQDSYSTCSAYGTGSGGSVGGLIGSASDGGSDNTAISNCYATGLVSGTASNKGALIGEMNGGDTLKNSYYYGIVNQTDDATTGGKNIMPPVGSGGTSSNVSGVADICSDVGAYQSFMGIGEDDPDGDPYDDVLDDDFPFKTLTQLVPGADSYTDTHVGDWPSYSKKTVNEKNA